MPAFRQPEGLRQHHAKYNLDNESRARLRKALDALRQHDTAFLLALDEVGTEGSGAVANRARAALRLLVEGPEGQFR